MTAEDKLRLDQQVCFPIYAASNLMTRLYRPLLERLELTYPQYLVMLALWEETPRTVGDLGKTLLLDTGTLTPLLKRLESAGLIERRRAEDDERRVIITLTAEGQALKRKAAQVPEALLCQIPIARKELVSLRTSLRTLLAALASVDPRESTASSS